MAIRTVVLILLTLLSALFLVVNWAGITASVPVNLVYTDTEAPLGLILLLVLGALWIAGIIWALLQQAATLLEIRKRIRTPNRAGGLPTTPKNRALKPPARRFMTKSSPRRNFLRRPRTKMMPVRPNSRKNWLSGSTTLKRP